MVHHLDLLGLLSKEEVVPRLLLNRRVVPRPFFNRRLWGLTFRSSAHLEANMISVQVQSLHVRLDRRMMGKRVKQPLALFDRNIPRWFLQRKLSINL